MSESTAKTSMKSQSLQTMRFVAQINIAHDPQPLFWHWSPTPMTKFARISIKGEHCQTHWGRTRCSGWLVHVFHAKWPAHGLPWGIRKFVVRVILLDADKSSTGSSKQSSRLVEKPFQKMRQKPRPIFCLQTAGRLQFFSAWVFGAFFGAVFGAFFGAFFGTLFSAYVGGTFVQEEVSSPELGKLFQCAFFRFLSTSLGRDGLKLWQFLIFPP